MTERPLPVTAILATGVGMGLLGDYLLRAPGGPGLNILLLLAGLALSIRIVSQNGGVVLDREASALIGVGLLTAGALVWRGSELLRVGTFLAACGAFALPAFHAGRAWLRRAGVVDLVESLVGAGFNSSLGALRLFNRENWEEMGSDTQRGTARHVARSALRGLLLAAVPLVVFGALFISADQVFATIVADFVRIDLQAFASHLVLVGVLSWLTCGYLAGFTRGTRLEQLRTLQPVRPSLGIAEVATAMGLVNLLFLAFVVVQFRYLFGGAAWVQVTPDLTHAAYARAGFFQLVVAVALAVPWLLAADGLLGDRGRTARSVFGSFTGLHLMLLLAVVASAVQRMLVYQGAYGLTEDRIVATGVLVWLTGVVLWFGATVLSGRRDRFAFGALVGGLVVLGALHVLNPAALAARSNVERVGTPGGMDAEYVGSLGSDAAPIVLSNLSSFPDEARCIVANRLLRRWAPERPADWRSWNWSDSRARSAVAGQLGTLRSMAGDGECG